MDLWWQSNVSAVFFFFWKYVYSAPLSIYLFYFNFLNWRIIALQKFVVLCQTSTCISHRYTYIPALLNLSPSPAPSHPSRLIQSPCLSFLSHTENSCWLSILHVVLSRWVGHSFSSKEQASFDFMATITICRDFGAQENKVRRCSRCFSVCLPWAESQPRDCTSVAMRVRAEVGPLAWGVRDTATPAGGAVRWSPGVSWGHTRHLKHPTSGSKASVTAAGWPGS